MEKYVEFILELSIAMYVCKSSYEPSRHVLHGSGVMTPQAYFNGRDFMH